MTARAPRRIDWRLRLDLMLATVLAGVGVSQVWSGWQDGGIGVAPDGQAFVRTVLVIAMTAPLAWRRIRPLPTVSAVCVAIVAQLLTVAPYVPFLAGLLPMAIANYTAAAYAPRLRPAALVAVFATEAVIYARIPEERAGGEVLFAIFVALGTWLAGDVVRARLSRAEHAVEAARLEIAERETRAATARTEERARIARELHDVIAHSVSVMGVQAGAARTLLDADPQAARAALREVEATARLSVAELQRMLTVLRDESAISQGLAPQPGLAQIPALVEQMRSAGLPVELSLSDVGVLPAGVDLAAYRIVQEALTNALKHAGSPTSVRVRRENAHVQIEVRDSGTRVVGKPNPFGHGLVGMRERAQLYGGSLQAQTDEDGGFAVRACLPIGPDAAAGGA